MFEFEAIYIPVPSVVDGENVTGLFDITELQKWGSEGWDIAGIVPRTIGVSLKNEDISSPWGPTSYGGGMGGNVVGVYLILRRPLA